MIDHTDGADAHESNAFERHVAEVEALVADTKRFIVRNESILEQEGLKTSIETLERWVESYRRGLSAARKIADSGQAILYDVKDRLKLASDEIVRLEDEGGSVTNTQQAADTEELLKASSRLERLIPCITQMFCGEDHAVAETAISAKNKAA